MGMPNPGESGSNVAIGVYENGKHIGVKYQGELLKSGANLSRIVFSPAERKRQATVENTDAKRGDELKGLKLIPYEDLDKAQQYAEAGGTMPIVFTLRQFGSGGVWISPPVLDSSSDNFEQTFLYLIGQEFVNTTLLADTRYWFVGKQNFEDIVQSSYIISTPYTSSSSTCPLVGLNVDCDHSRFNFLADPLDTTLGSFTHIRTINKYTISVGIRVKPLYPVDASPGATLETYTLTVYRTDNDTGTTVTVGTLNTSDNSSITAISDTVSAGNYTYSIETTSVLASGVTPETILVEFRQLSSFPTSVDRTADYSRMTMLAVKANMYDLTKSFSPPSALKQLHIFVREGMYVDRWRFVDPDFSTGPIFNNFGPSNRFVDLVNWWFVNSGKFPNENYTNFFTQDCAVCARFNARHNISFHAYITSTTNFMSYVQSVAPMVLCSFYESIGSYGMAPLLPVDNTGSIDTDSLTPRAVFTDSAVAANSTDGTIIEGSYSVSYKSTSDRLPITVVVTYRAQDLWNLEAGQTLYARYPTTEDTAPQEVYDMTAFCTDPLHATIFAKYTLATRKHSTHTISFQTAQVFDLDPLLPLNLIEVSLGRENSAGDNRTETNHYLIDKLDYDPSGITTITATHFPLDESGASIISNDIINGSFVVTT